MSENLPHRQPVNVPPMQAVEWEGELPLRLREVFASEIVFRTYLGQNFVVVPAASIVEILTHLNRYESFDTLTDLTAVDHPLDERRFEIIYILYSFANNKRLRVKTFVAVDETVPSMVTIYPAANWMEREVFDMFGVRFADHPNLKRILMPDEWHGFPLRKDMSITDMDNDWVRQNLGIESGQ